MGIFGQILQDFLPRPRNHWLFWSCQFQFDWVELGGEGAGHVRLEELHRAGVVLGLHAAVVVAEEDWVFGETVEKRRKRRFASLAIFRFQIWIWFTGISQVEAEVILDPLSRQAPIKYPWYFTSIWPHEVQPLQDVDACKVLALVKSRLTAEIQKRDV